MPATPLSDETLHLIDAVRTALEGCSDVQEKRMFGCHVFMVNGKLCLGVEGDEVLVRLLPATHAEVAETPGVRPLSSKGQMDGYFYISPAAYATRDQWQHWIDAALAYNPLAKATPKKARKAQAAPVDGKPAAQEVAKRPVPDARRSTKVSNTGVSSVRKTAKTPVNPAASHPASASPPPRKHSVFDDDDML